MASKERGKDAKKLLLEIRSNSGTLYEEIASFVKLLEESGVTSYRLSASIEEPVITPTTYATTSTHSTRCTPWAPP